MPATNVGRPTPHSAGTAMIKANGKTGTAASAKLKVKALRRKPSANLASAGRARALMPPPTALRVKRNTALAPMIAAIRASAVPWTQPNR